MQSNKREYTLPPELWLLAVEALKEGAVPRLGRRDPVLSLRRKTLLALIKVSRKFHAMIEPVLYEDVYLNSENYKKTTKTLTNNLETHPEKLQRINSVRLYRWDFLLKEALEPPTLTGPHTKSTPLPNRVLDLIFRMPNISSIQLDRIIAPASLFAFLFRLPALDIIHCTNVKAMLPWPTDFSSNQIQARNITLRLGNPGNISSPNVRQAHQLLELEVNRLVYAGSFTSDLSDFIRARSPQQIRFTSPEPDDLEMTAGQALQVGFVGPLGYPSFSSSFHTFRTIAAYSPHLITAHLELAPPESGTVDIPAGAFQSLQHLSAPAWLAAKILPGRSVKHLTILGLGYSRRFNWSLITSISSVMTLTLQAGSWEAFALDKINECFPSLELIELHLSRPTHFPDLEVSA